MVSLCLLWAPSLAAFSQPLGDRAKQKIVNRIGKLLDRRAYVHGVDFTRWRAIAASHQNQIDAAKTEHTFGRAINAALKEFDSSHIYLKTPEMVKALKRGHRVGIGMGGVDLEDGVLVGFVIHNSPAYHVGLRRGDMITHIDGEKVNKRGRLFGRNGQYHTLVWQRENVRFEKELLYGPYPVSSPDELVWLDEQTAWITIHSFRSSHYDAEKIDRFFREVGHAKGLILDLRGNPGGSVANVYHLAGLVLPRSSPVHRVAVRRHYRDYLEANNGEDGSLREVITRFGTVAYPMGKKPPLYRNKLVVLIDSLSGSGGELFPAAIQEVGRARIIGTQTRGLLLLSRSYRLPKGFRLQLPFGEITTYKGHRVEGVGVTPDIELDHRQSADDSFILQEARKWLYSAQIQAGRFE